MSYRIEHDTFGEIKVPAEHMWGAQTQRSFENFKIGKDKMPEEIIRAFAILKKSAAIVNKKSGKLSAEKEVAIKDVCDEIIAGQWKDEFPLVIYQTGSGTQSNMNMNEVIAHIANEKLKEKGIDSSIHPNDDVNMSQSSNDTFPTAMHIAVIEALHHNLYRPLQNLIDTMEKQKQKYMHLVKIGRTHLQDAVPLTFGQEISGWQMMLRKSKQMIEESEKYFLGLAIGGTAVGTGLNSPAGFGKDVAKVIAKETGISFKSEENKFYALTGRDEFVFSHGALEALATDLMKIADDIRLLACGPRAGLGEITLPANEPGSSIMPGKVNPTQCEALTMVTCRVHGNQSTISMASSQGRFELNAYAPIIAHTYIESVHILGDAIQSFNDHCLKGMTANEDRMNELVEKSLMLVTALSPHIGYEKSAEIAKKAFHEGTSLKEAAMALGYVTEKDYDHMVVAKDMTKV